MASRKTSTTNPVEAEALEIRVAFEWRGEKFTVLPSSEWPYEAIEAFEDGQIARFLRAILGEEEHNHFKSLHPKATDVAEFVEAMQSALGIQGN